MTMYLFKHDDGCHAGPLFLINKKRPLVRPKNKRGQIQYMHRKRNTPSWADKKAIAEVYVTAACLTIEHGEKFEVDHIVPLVNPIVCGLHVAWNLRAIHWLENAKKGNATWPDMPMEQMQLI